MRIINFFLLVLLEISLHAKEVELITYNAGLAEGYVAYAKERVDPMIFALKNEDADIVCLQEVWDPEHQERLREKMHDHYPYVLVGPTEQKSAPTSPACSPTDLIGENKLGPCIFKNCLSKSGSNFSECVTHTCQKPLQKLKNEKPFCLQALLGQVGKPLWKILLSALNPFSSPGLFTYQGNTGIMLLSRHPFLKTEIIDLKELSTTVHRGAIYAKVQIENRPLHLLCTHLTSYLSDVPYAGNFKSWNEENYQQAYTLAQWVLRYAKGTTADESILFMGDFNSGPSLPARHIEAEVPETFQMLIHNNFYDHYVYDPQVECSFCLSNTLVPKNPQAGNKNILIDHFFSKNFAGQFDILKARLILKETFALPVKEKKFERQNLSDHYGLKIKIQPR